MNKCIVILIFFLISCSDQELTKDTGTNIIEVQNNQVNLEILNGMDLGLNFKHEASFSELFSIYEPLGSGVAIIDYDNDKDMDVFVVQYGSEGVDSKLYNNDQMQFTDVTEVSGLGGLNGLIFASSADVNNDGYIDLLLGGENNLSLWINQGNGVFNNTKMIKATMGQQFYTGASWFDLNRDGYLDLWVTNYVDDAIPSQCKSPNGDIDYCPPKSYRYLPDLLFINQKGQSFKLNNDSKEIAKISPGLGVVSDDFDNNGWLDIYVANDGVANQLFFNYDGVLSEDKAKKSGAAFNLMGASEASMGIAIGDIDNNSYSDLYITHFKGETNTLYLNDKGLFADKTTQSKLVQYVRPLTGFGSLFTDYNADNLLDIVIVNGSTQHDDSLSQGERLLGEPIQFWENTDTLAFNYVEVAEENFEQRVGRGLISSDLDNDGDYDFIVSNNNQNMTVIQNHSNPDDWIGIDVMCNNRIDYGAKLEIKAKDAGVKSVFRTIHVDGSYASSVDARVLIYDTSQFDTVNIRWSASQQVDVFKIDGLNKNSYNQLSCKP
jgi:hypothetical protein